MNDDHINLNLARRRASVMTRGISLPEIYGLASELLIQNEARTPLLDYGAGAGDFLRRLHGDLFPGEALAGADIMERPADFPADIPWHTADLNEPLGLPDASFATIVSCEVIEHLENPRAVFREFFRLLKPGGLLVVTTPNQESLRSYLTLVTRGHFAQFQDRDYPAHIVALLRTDLRRISREAGFEEAEFFFTNAGVIPLPRVAKKWHEAGLGFLKGRWFSDNLALVCKATRGK